MIFAESIWRDVRVVEGARLESVYTVRRIKGSNPFLSVNKKVVEILQKRNSATFLFFTTQTHTFIISKKRMEYTQ